jgi:hypothetical protein
VLPGACSNNAGPHDDDDGSVNVTGGAGACAGACAGAI